MGFGEAARNRDRYFKSLVPTPFFGSRLRRQKFNRTPRQYRGLNSYVCVTVGRNDMSKVTEGSWQGSFTISNERAVGTLKPSSEKKKHALREFLHGQNLLVNLPTGFPASSNRCRCTAAYSAI